MMTDGSVIKRKELNPKRRTSEGKGGAKGADRKKVQKEEGQRAEGR